MFFAVIFFLLGAAVGFLWLYLVRAPLAFEEKIVWGNPIGNILLTAWIFGWAYMLPLQAWGIAVGFVTAFLMMLSIALKKDALSDIRHCIGECIQRMRTRGEYDPWLVVMVPWLLYGAVTIPRLLFFQDGALIAGWINTWGDWATHLRSSTFLASSPYLTLENPLLAGKPLSYPPLPNYLSAILQQMGLGVDRSLTWPSFVFFASLPGIFYILGKRISQNKHAGVVFAYIVLLAGGMGVIYLLSDLWQGNYFWQASPYSPHLYTDVRVDGHYDNSGIWFMNFIISEWFPQRAFLVGIPLALYVIYSVWSALDMLFSLPALREQNRPITAVLRHRARRNLVFSGFLLGILPLVHAHSFITLALFLPLFTFFLACKHVIVLPMLQGNLFRRHARPPYIRNLLRMTIWFAGPAVVVGLAAARLFLSVPDKGWDFFDYLRWWVPVQEIPVNPVAYWLRNAGPLLIVGLASAVLLWKERWSGPFLFAGAGLFLLGNFIKFQPWHYDNLKILTYWYIVWSLPVAVVLTRLLPRFEDVKHSVSNIFVRHRVFNILRHAALLSLFIMLMVLFMGAGTADVLSVTASTRTGLPLADKEGIAFAELVRHVTENDSRAIIAAATAPHHDHPVLLLSGRPLYVGYEGWLWTYGAHYQNRPQEIKSLYTIPTASREFLQENNIRYIVLGPQERYQYGPDEEEFLRLFPIAAEYGQYRLLRVDTPSESRSKN